jgi:hypothetical protein
MEMTISIGRGGGKTLKLIKQSAETGIYILVKNRQRAFELRKQAQKLGYDIPFPITVEEWVRSSTKFAGSCIRRDGIYVDDGEDVLQEFLKGLEIHEITLTANEKTKWLNANQNINIKENCYGRN